MYTRDLSIFTQMTQIAKNQNLDYKILYSCHQRNASNGLTEVYKLILCTNLFTVNFESNLAQENTCAIKDFLKYNSDACVELNFDVKFDTDTAEFKRFN